MSHKRPISAQPNSATLIPSSFVVFLLVPVAKPHGSTVTYRSLMILRPCHGPSEFPALVAIWRSAVDATHDFLATAHRDAIETKLASDYFPAVTLTVAEQDGAPVGFAGTAEGCLEMLFVHDDVRGRGVGTALLNHVLPDASDLEVNEQNPEAVAFYESRGYTVVGRREHDDFGMPYPFIQMRRIRGK